MDFIINTAGLSIAIALGLMGLIAIFRCLTACYDLVDWIGALFINALAAVVIVSIAIFFWIEEIFYQMIRKIKKEVRNGCIR